jgi:hypothetical protein
MMDAKPMATPMATGTKLWKPKDTDELIDSTYYQSIVGSIMYPMLCTRPDLAYTISQLSQFNATPTMAHLSAAKRSLRYLNNTVDMGLTFSGSEGLVLEAYCDSDWGAGEDRKSISGILILLAGGAIIWQSKKQSTVALSSTEGEYMALVLAAKEIIWINQCVENGRITLEYCETADMLADALTKPLAKQRFQEMVTRMGLQSFVEGLCHHQPETSCQTARKVGVLEYSELSEHIT